MNKAVILGIVLSLAGITACGSSNSDFYDDLRYVATKDLAINKSATRIPIGKTEQLVPVFTPDSATERGVNWQTDDNTIVTVDSTGTITGVELGTSRITMTTADGSKTAYCDVTVIPETTTTTFSTGTTFTLVTTPTVKEVTTGVKPQFPTGTSDTPVDVPDPFMMSETDVTYQLCEEVYEWAISIDRGSQKYTFPSSSTPPILPLGQNGTNGNDYNKGFTPGSTQYPVTKVTWRDAIVWCNALTEYYNAHNGSDTDLAVVYYSDAAFATPIRESTNGTIDMTHGAQDNPYVNINAKGFRLPTSIEYEFAARYIGSIKPLNESNWVNEDGVYYTKGNWTSGAVETEPQSAAVYLSIFSLTPSTATVKSKAANALGLYDMSGNILKWLYDEFNIETIDPVTHNVISVQYYRRYTDGAYNSSDIPKIGDTHYIEANFASANRGFRVVRSK